MAELANPIRVACKELQFVYFPAMRSSSNWSSDKMVKTAHNLPETRKVLFSFIPQPRTIRSYKLFAAHRRNVQIAKLLPLIRAALLKAMQT
jgi:hypothetical protein